MNVNPELREFIESNSKEFEKLNPLTVNAFVAECQELYNAGFTPGGDIRTRLDEINRRAKMLLSKESSQQPVVIANSSRGMIKTASGKLNRLARRRAMRLAGIGDLSKNQWHATMFSPDDHHGEEIKQLELEIKNEQDAHTKMLLMKKLERLKREG